MSYDDLQKKRELAQYIITAHRPDGTIHGRSTLIEPIIIDGFNSVRQSRNIVHSVIGSKWPTITYKDAARRTGKLSMLFPDASKARLAQNAHALAPTLVIRGVAANRGGPGSLEMVYTAIGDIELELDDETRKYWWLHVDYQETRWPGSSENFDEWFF